MNKKQTTARAAAAVWQQPCPCGAAGCFFVGLHDSRQLIILYPTPAEVNSRAENFSKDQNIHVVAAPLPWPIELVGHLTWEQYMGQPMVQDVRGEKHFCLCLCGACRFSPVLGVRRADTCALVACIKCVEAVHRLEHEKLHGKGTTFTYIAAPPSESGLLEACHTDGIWKPCVGARVRDVLQKIRQIGGVLATTGDEPVLAPPRALLPLRSWEEHRWDDFAATALSPGRVADLLHNNGPCVGVLWVFPMLYDRVDADRNDELVYCSGCGRSDDDARRSIAELHPETAWHAVVCFDYRFRGDQMHVLVLDNHDATGPRRWIHVEEFHVIYALSV